MGIDTLALTDHDGLYGVVRFAEAAKKVGVRTAFGQVEPGPARPTERRPGPGQHPPAGP
jgi:error-prone DNA polymerase